ncbi:MAG: hypothetical protein V1779_00715, partial [bacterium]
IIYHIGSYTPQENESKPRIIKIEQNSSYFNDNLYISYINETPPSSIKSRTWWKVKWLLTY